MAQQQQPEEATGTDVELSPQLIEKFRGMVTMLPEVDTSGGLERLIGKILDSSGADDIDAAWTARKWPLGIPVRVMNVSAARSDYDTSRLGYYVVADCVDLETGEAVQYTTGAESAVTQLTAMHAMQKLPWLCKMVAADKTKPGQEPPLHLETIRAGNNGKPGPRRG